MDMKRNKRERIKVYCRLKPILSELTPIKYILSKRCKNGSISINLKNENIKPENSKYKFHDIFPSTSTQSMIFEKVASPMINEFVQKGVNCTIFSYGQTGSGKTYTICGSSLVKDRGIIHQTFDQIFKLVQASSFEEKYKVNVSFIEIYNNTVRDLTTTREPKNKIEAHKILITNKSDAMKLFEKIKLKRKTSTTNRNEHSSRSHFICTIYLCMKGHRGFDAQFKLVDLAGSEDYNSFESNSSNQTESLAIKKSLYSLKNVTRILANPQFKGNIPYRDSKLTYELRSTLEGKCRVAMIANVDSNEQCVKELVNTFEYAREIASIKKCAVYNTKCATSVEMNNAQLRIENEHLSNQLSSAKEEIVLLKKENDLSLKKNSEARVIRKYIEAGDNACTTHENSDEQWRRQIWSSDSTLQINDYVKLDVRTAGGDMCQKFGPVSTIPLEPGESSEMQKENRKKATESNQMGYELGFMKNCLDRVMFGDKRTTINETRPFDATAFEDDDHALAATHEARDWRPYGRDFYHKARCCSRPDGTTACGFCELGLKPVPEPSPPGPGPEVPEPRLFHYLVCQHRMAGRSCAHCRTAGKIKANFYFVEAVPSTECGARHAADRTGPSSSWSSLPPSPPPLRPCEWLPYGRHSYHEILCRRSDGVACQPCDYGHAREPAEAGGGPSHRVHYVWCPKKMNGRPCRRDDECFAPDGLASWAAVDAAAPVETSRPLVDATTVRPPVKEAECPRAKETEQPRAKELQRPRAKEVQRPRAKEIQRPRAKEVQRPQAEKAQRSRANAISAPRPTGVKQNMKQTTAVDEENFIDYLESVLTSMEVPTKFTKMNKNTGKCIM